MSAVGKIVIPSGKFVKCSILDASSTGALLGVASSQAVPDTFKLEDGDTGRRRSVRVTRRGKTRIGVTYC
jgi:hypothetical protein